MLNTRITPRSKCEKAAAEQADTTGVHSVRRTSAFVRILESDRCEILGLMRKYRKLHNTSVNRICSVFLTLIALAVKLEKNTLSMSDTANARSVENHKNF